ncbi:Bug family tripartite tricarboxylate transporter substrate binding protein [Oryzicola mucosus]|uniref:Tripartite tricarboxylate transporter substrate binding protein n=1 Tax=Oryzicola mucosus TaxID=2767425 RepID=A0A8J6PR19_9HYPH|nr:tripartite tricarboxylate transporter substrate binding protein [Oryzicola mucosus]MBD0417352.1 tripartite tricarboxylate transporter substrate binding protein [Oryzicola mucosus]
MMKLLQKAVIAAGIVVAVGSQVQAQDWPSKPIELVSVGAAGGSTDNVWRVIADSVTKTLGQAIAVNYKPGGGGHIAGEYTARQPADGYSFMLTTIHTHGITPNIYKSLKYNPIEDLRGVARLVTLPNVLYANSNLPINSVQNLIAYAKANPGKINYASSSLGASTHMSMVLFSQKAGIEMNHIPYKASAPAVQGILSGEADISFENLSAVMSQISAKTVKALAVSSAKRWPELPDVPTVAEAGLPGFEVSSWFGIVAPKGTPDAIVDKFSAAVEAALKDPANAQKMHMIGAEAAYLGPTDMDKMIREEVGRWKPVVEASGVKPE